jgi:multiple sugar transport system permease protein
MTLPDTPTPPQREPMYLARRGALPLVFLMPSILILLAFQVIPGLYTLYLSTTLLRRGTTAFVGWDNYLRLFQLPSFNEAIGRTLVFAGSYITLTVVIGFALALLLNRNVRFTQVYLVILFIPWVLSDVVTGTIWRWLFQPSYGILQEALFRFIDTPLYVSPIGAMGIVITASVWQSLAFTTILSLSALQTIPRELTEAAAIDGAGSWQRLKQVTLPLIRRHLLVITLLTSIRGVNAVGLIYATTDGGPGRSTQTLAVYLLTLAREQGEFGLGASISVIMLSINLILTAFYLIAVRQLGIISRQDSNG